jgi:hypothetical protein
MPETSQKIRHVFEDGVVRPIDGTLFPRKETVDHSTDTSKRK